MVVCRVNSLSVWTLVAASLLWRCASVPPEPTAPSGDAVQPAAPVQLEKVVTIGFETGPRRLWRRLVGGPPPELFRRPFGLAWDGRDLLVADPGARRVIRLNLQGRVEAQSARGFESPIGVGVCEMGIVVTDSRAGAVHLLDRSLQTVRTLTEGLQRPTGVACLGDEVFVAETARHRLLVLRMDPSGRVVEQRAIGSRGNRQGEFNYPTFVTMGPDSLWIADTMNFRVQEIDPATGAYLAHFGGLGDAPGDMPRIKGLAVDASGRLWVSDAYLDQVGLYGTDGTFLTGIGASGSAPAEFSFPAGIAAAAGRVAIADSLNRRIQVFREVDGGAVARQESEEQPR